MHRQTIAELNDELRGLILFVRDQEIRAAEENLSGQQIKDTFSEMYPPATLFSQSVQSMPAIYPAIQNWLNKQGAALTTHSSHRIIMALAMTI